MDRKEKVKKLSEFLNATPKYLAVPSFAYEISGQDETYTIDRQGTITTSAGTVVTLEEILNAPQQEESAPTDGLDITLLLEGHTEVSLQNVVSMLSSKQHLIMMAFETKTPIMDDAFAKELSEKGIQTLADFKAAIDKLGKDRCQGLTFDFENSTLTFKLLGVDLQPEKLNAFKNLCVAITNHAKTLNRASFKKAQDDNPKYAFRTWLIRLGMNGSEYKGTRKALMDNLSGSGAFRTVGERVDG